MEDTFIKTNPAGVPYGSFLFCETIAQQMGWKLLRNSFDWLAALPIEYTKRQVEYMTLSQARLITDRKFIKPADDKCFDAAVYEPGTFNPTDVIAEDYPTLVSEPVEFTLEYRCFVSDGKVQTWSNYIYHEHLADPKFWDAVPGNAECMPHEFVDDMLSRITVPTVPSVIDVGMIPGKGWAIIETNEAYASGLYGCDPIEALQVMYRACEPDSIRVDYYV